MDSRKYTCDNRPMLAKAEAEGRSLTDVLRAYLRRYISTPPRKRDGNDSGS